MKNKEFYNDFVKGNENRWYYKKDKLYHFFYWFGGEDMQFAFSMRILTYFNILGLVLIILGGIMI